VAEEAALTAAAAEVVVPEDTTKTGTREVVQEEIIPDQGPIIRVGAMARDGKEMEIVMAVIDRQETMAINRVRAATIGVEVMETTTEATTIVAIAVMGIRTEATTIVAIAVMGIRTVAPTIAAIAAMGMTIVDITATIADMGMTTVADMEQAIAGMTIGGIAAMATITVADTEMRTEAMATTIGEILRKEVTDREEILIRTIIGMVIHPPLIGFQAIRVIVTKTNGHAGQGRTSISRTV
jgi:hypothetical protein